MSEIAALVLESLVWKVFAEDRTWACAYCGTRTSILCEICDGCGIEDCSQGQED